MEPPKMDNKTKFWDRISGRYDDSVNESELANSNVIMTTRKYLGANDRVLDFACGTGNFSIPIAKDVGEILAIDISAKMLAIAEDKIVARGIQNVRFARASLSDATLQPASFDSILAFNILHLLDDPQAAVKRIGEILKPGGIFISESACMGEKNAFVRAGFSLFGLTGFLPKLNAFRIAELEVFIRNGGFEILEAERVGEESASYFVVAKKG
jgi:ubiquinone/menaquinone biosynthesis C-methylase UbiE